MRAETPEGAARLRVTTAGQFATATNPAMSLGATATAPKRRRRIALRSVRLFSPTLDDISAQNFDPSNEAAASAFDIIATRFSDRQRAALYTTIQNALKLDAQGYELKPLGQMRYRVIGGNELYVYDHAAVTCTCPLWENLRVCKHSVWAWLKIDAAAALLATPSPEELEENPFAAGRAQSAKLLSLRHIEPLNGLRSLDGVGHGRPEPVRDYTLPQLRPSTAPRDIAPARRVTFRVFDEDGKPAGEWDTREGAENRAAYYRRRAVEFRYSNGRASRVRIEEIIR